MENPVDVTNVRADEAKDPAQVAAMFDAVADRYDLTNQVISMGQVGLWRRAVRRAIDPRPGQRILDVAGGTGSSSAPLAQRGAEVIVCDISQGMLETGRSRHDELTFVWGSATDLPFEDDTFDAVTISFGIRNVDEVEKALVEMRRVTKPGGRLVVCEFSSAVGVARVPHRLYLRFIAPNLARLVSPAAGAYDYLTESILQWPRQEAFAQMILDAGWRDVSYRNLTYGAVAIHRAFKR